MSDAMSDAFNPVSEPRSAMKPIVFLDIDDVLCLSDPYGGFDAIEAVNDRHIHPAAVYRGLFVATAAQALKRVHDEMDADIGYVISSTWRESFSREQLAGVFRCAGLGFVADHLVEGPAWRTPPRLGRSRRVDEVAECADRHHWGQPFVIVDDARSGASLAASLSAALNAALSGPAHATPHPFAGRVVLCTEHIGLTDLHVQPIVDALRRAVVPPFPLSGAPESVADNTQGPR